MPQVDITLIFIILQAATVLVTSGYIFYTIFLLPLLTNTKLPLKLFFFVLILSKIIIFRSKLNSNYIYLKNLKF